MRQSAKLCSNEFIILDLFKKIWFISGSIGSRRIEILGRKWNFLIQYIDGIKSEFYYLEYLKKILKFGKNWKSTPQSNRDSTFQND